LNVIVGGTGTGKTDSTINALVNEINEDDKVVFLTIRRSLVQSILQQCKNGLDGVISYMDCKKFKENEKMIRIGLLSIYLSIYMSPIKLSRVPSK
jgi:KaiC/GvpD/RAD55 family RecA-like ATPase